MPVMQARFSARHVFVLVAAALLAFHSLAPTSTAQQTQFQLAALKFTGLKRYSEAKASSASGVRIGDTVSVAQLQSASDRLGQSGAFDRVSFRYMTQGNNLNAEFQVTETATVFPCIFDNFVWFSPDELDRALRARVPFYDGTIPQRGTIKDQTSAALQALLQANGVSGAVESLPFYEKMGGPVTGFSFHVNGVSMPVRSIHFPGASAVSDLELGTGASEIIGKDYSATDIRLVGSIALLAIYHRRGYLQAHFDPPQAKIDGSDRASSPIPISVTMPVTEGLQFRWSGATWTGNIQFPSDDLGNLFAMKPQEIANQDKIDAGISAVMKAYSKQGYIDATVRPEATLNDAAQLVTYDVTLSEGTQFRMGQVHFQGVSDKLAAEFTKRWQLHPGQIYDGTYAKEFMKKVIFPKLAEMRLPANTSIGMQRDNAHATVDLQFAFQ
jgi:outer membrane protein assembly factor BamA